MGADEARACVDQINGHFGSARRLIYELHDREGWRSLGYSSWPDCVANEFEEHRSAIYRQLDAARIEVHLSPNGDKESFIGSIPEGQLRPIARFRDEPEKARAIFNRAVESAGDRRVTARHVEAAVEELYPRREAPDEWEDNPSLAVPPARPALPGQSEFALEPEVIVERPPADRNAERWGEFVEDMNRFLVSLPRRGGIAGLTARWSAGRRRAFADYLEEFGRTIDAAVAELRRMDQ